MQNIDFLIKTIFLLCIKKNIFLATNEPMTLLILLEYQTNA